MRFRIIREDNFIMKRRDFVKLISLGGGFIAAGGGSFILHSCDSSGSGGGDMNLDPRSPEGFINQLLVPGEQLYLFHCHNLEHEDQGMMINYSVV